MADKKNVWIKVTASLTGLFNLAFHVGDVVEVDAETAKEIVDVRRGEYTDAPKKADKKETPAPKETPAEKKARENAVEAEKARLSDAFVNLKTEADALKVEYTDETTFEELTALVDSAKNPQA